MSGKLLRQYRTIFTGPQRRSFIALILILIFGSLLETLTISLMYPFMYLIMGTSGENESRILQIVFTLFGKSDYRQSVFRMAILIACVYLAKGAYLIAASRAQNKCLADTRAELSERLFHALLARPYEYHLHSHSAVVQRVITEDVKRIFDLINSIFTLISELVTGGLIVAVLLIDNASMTMYAAGLILATVVVVNRFIKKIVRESGVKATGCETEMIRWVAQTMGALKGIKVNKKEKNFERRYSEYAEYYACVRMKYLFYASLPKTITEAVTVAGMFIYMAFLIASNRNIGHILPMFATFALAAIRLLPIFSRVNVSVNTIQYNANIFEYAYELLREHGDRETADGDMPQETHHLKTGISVEHISFRFSDAKADLFSDVSLQIPAGQSVAFIGTTGAGKSTMADLIMGLHRPLSGAITCDGKEIGEIQNWWAGVIGYIPQSIYLCDDTIAANVAFGVPANEINIERVWECLEEAQLKAFVESLPDRVETMTGENGVRLSGGQRQRIGIARALYADPLFLVMDEATSALDHDTEATIIDAINRLAGRKTLLIIAHRLTTIRACDIIYRIQDGRVLVEKGVLRE